MLPTELISSMYSEGSKIGDIDVGIDASFRHLQNRLNLTYLNSQPLAEVPIEDIVMALANIGSDAFELFTQAIGPLNFGGDIYLTGGVQVENSSDQAALSSSERFRYTVSCLYYYLSGIQPGMVNYTPDEIADRLLDSLDRVFPNLVKSNAFFIRSQMLEALGRLQYDNLLEEMNLFYHRNLIVLVTEFHFRSMGDRSISPVELITRRINQLMAGVERPEYFELVAAVLVNVAIAHDRITDLLAIDWASLRFGNPQAQTMCAAVAKQLADYQQGPTAYIQNSVLITRAMNLMSDDIDSALADNTKERIIMDELPNISYFADRFASTSNPPGMQEMTTNVTSLNKVLELLDINYSVTMPTDLSQTRQTGVAVRSALAAVRQLSDEIAKRGMNNLAVCRASLADFAKLLELFVVEFSKSNMAPDVLADREEARQQLSQLAVEVEEQDAQHNRLIDYFYQGSNQLEGAIAVIVRLSEHAGHHPQTLAAYRQELTRDAVRELHRQPVLDTYASQFININRIQSILDQSAFLDLQKVLEIGSMQIKHTDGANMATLVAILKQYQPAAIAKRKPEDLILQIRQAIFTHLAEQNIISPNQATQLAKAENQQDLPTHVFELLSEAWPAQVESSQVSYYQLARYVDFRVWWQQNFERLNGLTYIRQIELFNQDN